MPRGTPKQTLSPVEVEILELTAKGYNFNEIGEMLGMTSATISERRRRIYRFLGARNAPHAVYIAIGEGYLV